MEEGSRSDGRILRQLDDEHRILKLVLGFSLGMDTRDAELFRASWAPEIELDLPPLAGDAIRFAGPRMADEYASDVISLLSEFQATQHVSTNHLVSVSGDDGSCCCYTLAQHYLPLPSGDPWLAVGARYDLLAHRFDDAGWRFTRFALRTLWWRGNGSLWREAAARMTARRASGGPAGSDR